ncbi:MAG TPA: M56 family metallopeptidase [Gemmatimonadaceae bacterium]|nr:M56 family metallopeptidase [Gemmatimonadaceae bacterium]
MRDALVTPLLDAALRGAVVLLAALVLTLLLHRRSAALRHAIWAGAIAAQLVLLGLAVWGPRWRIAAPDAVSALVPLAPDEAQSPPPREFRPSPVTTIPGAGGTVVTSTDSLAAPRAAQAASSAPTAETATPPLRRVSRTTILFVLWTLGVAAVLLRLGVGTVLVARLARQGRRVDDGGWLSLAQRLASTLRIDRPLTLMRGDRLGVPVTWGIVYPVVLLPDDADEWPEERRRYVLVHEMAHVKRLDALTQLVGQVALALFWFNPLMWIAVRRMQLEREHACDDYVLLHGTQPSRYAADLLDMVQSLGTPAHRSAQPAFAALAMARRSEFEGRMLSILDPVLDRHPLHRGRTLMSALATLLLIVPLAALQPYRAAAAPQSSELPSPRRSSTASSSSTANADDGVRDRPLSQRLQSLDSARASAEARLDRTSAALGTQDTARARISTSAATATAAASVSPPRPSSSSSNSSNSSSSSNSVSIDDDSCERFQYGSSQSSFHMHSDKDDAGKSTIKYLDFDHNHCRAATINGKIVTPDNEDRIVAVLPEGSGSAYFRERIGNSDRELSVSSNGATRYRVNGAERPYDDEGRRWFAALLPRVLAEASINVEQRVKYWRSQGGIDAALRHITDLRSSGAKRAHYSALLDNQLSGADLDRLVKQAGNDIPSSGDLRAVLSKTASQQNRTKVAASTLEDAIGAVPSSGDLTTVLLAFGQTDDREQLLAVARTALKIPSSGDLSRFLIEVAPRYLGRDDATLRDAYFKAVANVPSSGDRARVLLNTMPYAAKSPSITRSVLAAAGTVPSSGDRARVLIALAGSGALRDTALRDAYLKVASEIPASSDMRDALQALTRN